MSSPVSHDDSSSLAPAGAFGPYRVTHQIGVGVLGPVFRAYDPDDDRLLALKAFQLNITPEKAGTLAAALDEIVRAGLRHPSLVTPVGAGISDGVPYLAMEYVAPESLDVAIRRYAPGALGTALPFVVQLAEAIDTAHARGVSHGALHLRDVFVTSELAQVTGFGVVSALERVRLRGPLRRPYTAPEQIAGVEWGPAADRFALAAIAYELLTGKRAAGTGEQVADRLAELSDVRDAAGLTRLFVNALADTPETRPASARLFADEFADAVGWTGAGAVRQALVRMDSEAGDPEHQVSDDAPVIAVAGVSVRPSAGIETTGTEGAALEMAKTNRPESTPESALDWNEHTLDRGESDEPSEREAYRPRPPGGAPLVVTRAERAGDEGVHSVGAGSLFDRLDPDPGGPTVHAHGSSFSDPGARQPDDGEDSELHDESKPAPNADEGEDLSVVQARYRSVDDSSAPARDAQNSQAAGVYEALTLSDLQDRRGDTDDLSEDDSDDDPDWGTDLPAGPEARDGDADGRDDQALMFEADGEINYDRYGHDEDELQEGVLASGWTDDRARGVPMVPLALIAVVIIVAAFGAGFGWVAGGGDVVTDEPTAAEAVVAGGLTDPSEAPEPAEPAPQPSREFSEATVAGSPVAEVPVETVEAPVETSPTPPIAEPDPEEPGIPESAARPVPVAGTEATVARSPILPAVPEPAPPRADGRLLVRSTPPGVRVMVNGEARGTTPLALADLSYGAYDVQFSLDGYESQERRLAISSDDPIAAISAALAPVTETRTASLGVGSISVDTRPRGVEVWLDQQLVGETPMLIPDVSTGAHEVEFRHAGYRAWSTTVQVGSSAEARVTASLDLVPR